MTSGECSASIAVSIIVPMLNEAEELLALLNHLRIWQQCHCEVLLVDGGSSDASVELAEAAGFTVLLSKRGRAVQMNAGARQASGEVLLFLHADSRLPPRALQLLQEKLMPTETSTANKCWGRFNVSIIGDAFMFRIIAFCMNWRSRLTSIATGDQAIFVRRSAFDKIGGFVEQPLMEDIELSRQLKLLSRPLCLADKVTTSGRRWQVKGIWRTIFLMWCLRWRYWRGTSADILAQAYR